MEMKTFYFDISEFLHARILFYMFYIFSGERHILKPGSVPSIFECHKLVSSGTRISLSETSSFQQISDRATRANKRQKANETLKCFVSDDISCKEEVVSQLTPSENNADESIHPEISNKFTQCNDRVTAFSIERFKFNNGAIQYYTGLDDYEHFQLLFFILGPSVYELDYQCTVLLPEDQLFMTLMKLRQGKDDQELSILFEVSMTTVSNIVSTWINFMYFQFKEIDIWPSREVTDCHMPVGFKKLFPSTRVIIDGTEVPVQKPGDVNDQSATFSTYKNQNTLKTIIGVNPRGVVTFISDSYGGSASDRQVTERSELMDNSKWSDGDAIMADRGFLIQDLFCSKNVRVNIPTFLKGKSQLEPEDVIGDRRISSKRIHVERVIGLGKTYKILTKELQYQKLPIDVSYLFASFYPIFEEVLSIIWHD